DATYAGCDDRQSRRTCLQDGERCSFPGRRHEKSIRSSHKLRDVIPNTQEANSGELPFTSCGFEHAAKLTRTNDEQPCAGSDSTQQFEGVKHCRVILRFPKISDRDPSKFISEAEHFTGAASQCVVRPEFVHINRVWDEADFAGWRGSNFQIPFQASPGNLSGEVAEWIGETISPFSPSWTFIGTVGSAHQSWNPREYPGQTSQ